MENKKHHIMQRWYEQTEKERIVSCIGFWIFLTTTVLGLCTIYLTPVEVACSTGDIDLDLSLNSSSDLQNISIFGIGNMRCTFKGPMVVALPLLAYSE